VIDWTFEERLHERIDARKLIAERLTPRQRHVVRRTFLYGDTLKEIGERDGVTTTRISQILNTSLSRLRHVPEQAVVVARGKYDLRATPPPGFDWEEFRRHQAQLIEQREARARRRFEDAQRELAALLETEAPKPVYVPKPPPEPEPWYYELLKGVQPWQPLAPVAPKKWPGNVEPWFDLSRVPTAADLQQIGFYAINYFVAIRSPMRWGWPHMGHQGARIDCPRTADAVATGLQRLAKEIPHHVRFSTHQPGVPDGVLGASVGGSCVAMRVCSLQGGQRVSLEVAWDNIAE
jgi:hypothetical protein